MKSLTVCIVLAMGVCAFAEPPSGYNYNRPSGGGGGGFSGGLSGGGGGYQAVSSGYQSSEGQQVDGQLLEQIRQILLREESQSGAGGQGAGGYPSAPSSSYGAPSSSYGAPAPSSSYGAPSSSYGAPAARVVGVNLEGVRQAIQVAQFEQQSSGGSGGYPSGPSSSYSAPSSSYGAPARAPSSSYGAPF